MAVFTGKGSGVQNDAQRETGEKQLHQTSSTASWPKHRKRSGDTIELESKRTDGGCLVITKWRPAKGNRQRWLAPASSESLPAILPTLPGRQ